MLTETPIEMAMLMASLADRNETIRATVTERAVVMFRRQPPDDEQWRSRSSSRSVSSHDRQEDRARKAG